MHRRIGMLCPQSPVAMVRMLLLLEDSADHAPSAGF
jgi:hypothetical protein